MMWFRPLRPILVAMSLPLTGRESALRRGRRGPRREGAVDPVTAGLAIVSSGIRATALPLSRRVSLLAATGLARSIVEQRRAAQRLRRRRRDILRSLAAGFVVGGTVVALRGIFAGRAE